MVHLESGPHGTPARARPAGLIPRSAGSARRSGFALSRTYFFFAKTAVEPLMSSAQKWWKIDLFTAGAIFGQRV